MDVPDPGDLGDQPVRHPRLDAQAPSVQGAHRLHERGVLPRGGFLACVAQQLGHRRLVLRGAGEDGVLEGGGPRADVQEPALGVVAVQQLLGVARRHGGAAAGGLEHRDQLEQEPAGVDGPPEGLRVHAGERGVVVAHHVPVEQRPHVLGHVQLPVPLEELGHGGVGEVLEAHPAGDERVHPGLGEVGDAAPGHQVQPRLPAGRCVVQGVAGAGARGPERAAPPLREPGLEVEGVEPHAAHQHGLPRGHGLHVQLGRQMRTPVVQGGGAPGRLRQAPLGGAEHGVLVAQAQHDGVHRQLVDVGRGVRRAVRAARTQREAGAAVVGGVQRRRLGAVEDHVRDLRAGPQGAHERIRHVLEVAAVKGARGVVLPLEAAGGVRVVTAPGVEGGGDGGRAQAGVVRRAGRGEEGRGVHEQQRVLVRAPHAPGAGAVRLHEVEGPGSRAGLPRLEPGQEPVEHHDAPGADPHDGEGALLHDGPVHAAPPPGGGATVECTA